MTRARITSTIAALCAAGLLAALAVWHLLPAVDADKDDVWNLAFQPHPGGRLPLATRLVDEDGRPSALGDYFNRLPVIVVLEYLRCQSLCGVTLHNLVVDGLEGLPLEPGRDYELVAISIDPRDRSTDAAAARLKYASLLNRRGGMAGLHFLTASATAAREIADTIGFPYRYDATLDEYLHPAGFVVVAADGVISRYVEGVGISQDALIGALADAQQDKSQGLFTRVLLLCHIQGAPLGRLTVPVLAAFTAANIAAVITLVAIFAGIRRRRHG